MNVIRSGVWLLCFSVCSCNLMFAQQGSLEGLYAFSVIVEEIPADLVSAGISRVELQERVEAYLMDNGILVGDGEEAYLYVYLRGLELTNSEDALLGYSYTINLSVRQMAYLLRNMNFIDYVTTWSNIQLGAAPVSAIGEVMDRALVGSMDMFINDYHEANAD